MKRPSFQFYPSDWRNDTSLKMCSLPARGLWIEMICIMHMSEQYGHLHAAGRALDAKDMSKLIGESEKDITKWLAELVRNSVCSVNDEGVIFSRRMVKDEMLRDIRAAGGEAGKSFGKLGAEHGSKGGRPRKVTGENKPPLNPPPSSSSSSSSENLSVTNVTGDPPAAASPKKLTDPQEIIFSYGVPLLVGAGASDKAARSFFGGLRKVHGDAAVIDKLRECLKENPMQPLEWLAAALPPPHPGTAGKTGRGKKLDKFDPVAFVNGETEPTGGRNGRIIEVN